MANEDHKKRLAANLAEARRLRQELQAQFQERTVTLMSTALGVVAALFWQTAITDTIKAFIPVGGAWPYELGVAIVVTALAVLALFLLSRGARKA
ncbi:MAG: hypothetical protein KGH63_00455 [Candidatus Micrarchaeota archaeon]|nr:hypothetical protein [Candidatus Micrarchaeota archaeon]